MIAVGSKVRIVDVGDLLTMDRLVGKVGEVVEINKSPYYPVSVKFARSVTINAGMFDETVQFNFVELEVVED